MKAQREQRAVDRAARQAAMRERKE